MKTTHGKKYANAETTIDYKKKSIKFKYNNKEYNKKWENLAYFANMYYTHMSFIIMGAIYLFWIYYGPKLVNYYVTEEYQVWIMAITIITTIFILPLIIMGYTSIIVHKLSKTARKNFPKTNAIILENRNKKWNKINFKKNKEIYEHGYKYKNKYIHWKYDIVYFEYKYIGQNKLKKVYTKSTEPEGHRGEHTNYVCLFEFKKPITDGTLMWR